MGRFGAALVFLIAGIANPCAAQERTALELFTRADKGHCIACHQLPPGAGPQTRDDLGPRLEGTRMRALGTGAATCWLRLASAAAPVFVGYLVAARGTAAVFLMFAVAGVVGAVAGIGMLETRNKRLEELAS